MKEIYLTCKEIIGNKNLVNGEFRLVCGLYYENKLVETDWECDYWISFRKMEE